MLFSLSEMLTDVSNAGVSDLRDLAPAALEIVRDVSNDGVRNCLEGVLSDGQALATMAKLSYRHQLGFLKLVVRPDDPAVCLRLHVWDRLAQVQEDVHSHCAPFQSRLVLGSLRENSFSLSSGSSHALFRYRFDADAGHAVAIEKGTTGVEAISSRALRVGDIYTKYPNELHNVSDAMVGTVTVSAWGPRNHEALVLKQRGALAGDCVVATGMPIEELVSTIRDIIKRL